MNQDARNRVQHERPHPPLQVRGADGGRFVMRMRKIGLRSLNDHGCLPVNQNNILEVNSFIWMKSTR